MGASLSEADSLFRQPTVFYEVVLLRHLTHQARIFSPFEQRPVAEAAQRFLDVSSWLADIQQMSLVLGS
jgi:hypothetical protein